jgi:GNAT superfamily N-acetyltransferase
MDPAPAAMHEVVLRSARDEDSAGVITLITAVFAEYPGCVLDVDLEEPELRAPASSFDGFWVLETIVSDPGASAHGGARIVGCIGLGLHGAGPAELKKLYLARELRGRGLGARLVAHVEREALRRGATRIELWTDTRFTTAHAVYRRLGYTPTGAQRELHDLSATLEDHYTKALGGGGTEPAQPPPLP